LRTERREFAHIGTRVEKNGKRLLLSHVARDVHGGPTQSGEGGQYVNILHEYEEKGWGLIINNTVQILYEYKG
jgi:hypothetical protein